MSSSRAFHLHEIAAEPVVVPAAFSKVAWLKSVPFFAVHIVAVAGLFFFPISLKWLGLAVGMYYFRMWLITTVYHRYLSHRSFKTSRWFQFVLTFLATTSTQKGALWWAAHHRHHHKFSDKAEDLHSPKQQGFWWAHVGWILSMRYDDTRYDQIRDMVKFPELVWLNRFWIVPIVSFIAVLFVFGGMPAVFWGYIVSTTLLWHGTFTVNSLTHVFGKPRYKSGDESKNSWLIALITMGEGWHNNHHYYQLSARQGFFWWEFDPSFYILKMMQWIGLVWDVRVPPESVRKPSADKLISI